jgi:hypothetical protein
MPPAWVNSQEQEVRKYFRVKAKQLAATADLSVCDHPGLIGSHREELQRVFLRELLPARFSVGRGMVYGAFGHRSKEADIVIWDSQNYPSLRMLDHAFYFADSVRLVLECKSRWTTEEFTDVLEKCNSVHSIIGLSRMNLREEINMMQQEIYALKEGLEHDGALIMPHHIATAAIFLTGGDSVDAGWISADQLQEVDERWPDVTLFLGPQRVVTKKREEGHGWLEFIDLGEDSLACFTAEFLALLSERSVHVEEPFYLTKYAFPPGNEPVPTARVRFPLCFFPPQRVPLWREADDFAPPN